MRMKPELPNADPDTSTRASDQFLRVELHEMRTEGPSGLLPESGVPGPDPDLMALHDKAFGSLVAQALVRAGNECLGHALSMPWRLLPHARGACDTRTALTVAASRRSKLLRKETSLRGGQRFDLDLERGKASRDTPRRVEAGRLLPKKS